MIRIIGDKLRQYDINRQVELAPKSGLTLESVSFQKNGPEPLVTAHREEGGMIVADIPNILLKAYGTLTVECYLVDADGYHISEKASFTVCKRDMPADYEYVATPVLKLGAGGASSWNDLTDKPFGETAVGGDTLTWDGNTEGLTGVNVSDVIAYKVSDAVFSTEDCVNGVNSSLKLPNMVIQEECVISNNGGVSFAQCAGFLAAFSVPPECVGVDLSGVTFPEAGTYLVHAPFYHCSSLTIPGFGGFPSIKPIDKKYLPADAVGSTRFYVHTDYHKIYVDPANEVEATSADVDAALDKGPVYFEDMLAQHITSMFQIELGNTAGYYIRLIHCVGGNLSDNYVTTSDFERGVE